MLNGVGTNISMAYTSKYNNKSTGDKMDIEFEIGNSEQKEAEEDALEQCKDDGGKACKVVVSYSNLCLSSGMGERNGTYFDVFGVGANKAGANKDAIREIR